MNKERNSQMEFVNALVDVFRQNVFVYAVILVGSLVERPDDVDEWSDVDIKLVIEDGAETPFLDVVSWTQPFGRLVGMELFRDVESTTLRICLENYHRLDLVLIPRNKFERSGRSISVFQKVLWQRESLSKSSETTQPIERQTIYELKADQLMPKVNALWFQAAVAISKVVRDDYLVAYHLTLNIMQGVLELQMMRCDAALGTNVHHNGGWGNELISQFPQVNLKNEQEGILILLYETCKILDEMAGKIMEDYEPRLYLLEPVFQKAKVNGRQI